MQYIKKNIKPEEEDVFSMYKSAYSGKIPWDDTLEKLITCLPFTRWQPTVQKPHGTINILDGVFVWNGFSGIRTEL